MQPRPQCDPDKHPKPYSFEDFASLGYGERKAFAECEADGGSTYLARPDLADFLGEWVSVTETVKFADDGTYSVKIVRMRDGKVLANVENAKLDMWRKDCTGMRPKWGLYRNFGEKRSNASQLRDEILKFADFDIEKLK